MNIVETHKTFMRISNKGFEIIDVDIDDKEKLKEIEESQSWTSCIRTMTETKDKK